MRRVLVIEDDEDIAELISIHLHDLGCAIHYATTGSEGLTKAVNEPVDLIILDIMLPGMDGLEICKRLRAREIFTPILILTAKSEEIDKVLGLETGADDYLTKPFSIREFVARVKAIFRRLTMQEKKDGENAGSILRLGELIIDQQKHKITIQHRRIELTPKEYDLLLLMALHPGKIFSREDLLNQIWGYEFSGYEHTVSSHVNRLRAKIEQDFAKPHYILTSWGVGYRFNDEITLQRLS